MTATARHPAQFTPAILDAIEATLRKYRRFLPSGDVELLDCFAGKGGIHKLMERLAWLRTTGYEREVEWAIAHLRTEVRDFLTVPRVPRWDAAATSPCYGNRYSDHHNAQDGSERRSYTHDLGHELSPNNAGNLPWGPAYRRFHAEAWLVLWDILLPGGLFVLNISNHYRAKQEQKVTEWHDDFLQSIGFKPLDRVEVWTPRMGKGANLHDQAKLPEYVLTYRKPKA